jgi:large conductance mechanosensitive channel
MLKGFRDFVLRGNVIDLAVGVIIGGAFKGIVDKLVDAVFNPALGAIVGKPNFDDAVILGPVKLGVVLTAMTNFVLTAAVMYFFLVLPTNKLLKRFTPPPAEAPDVKLLEEIRDLLAKNQRA